MIVFLIGQDSLSILIVMILLNIFLSNSLSYLTFSTIGALFVWFRNQNIFEYKDSAHLNNIESFLMINFLIAFALSIYCVLCWFLFGIKGYGYQQQTVFEEVLYLLSFKFLVVEMIIESNSLPVGFYVSWFLILSLSKGLLHHGQLKAILLSNTQANCKSYIVPSLHLVIVLGCTIVLMDILHHWIDENIYTDVYLVLIYDLLVLTLEFLHALFLYVFHVFNSYTISTNETTMNNIFFLENSCSFILIKFISFAHYCHVGIINGVSITLVLLSVFIHIQFVILQIYKMITEVKRYFWIIWTIDLVFEDVHLNANANVNLSDGNGMARPSAACNKSSLSSSEHLSSKEAPDDDDDDACFVQDKQMVDKKDDFCSICIQKFNNIAKKLPCGHMLHAECLKRLMQTEQNHTLNTLQWLQSPIIFRCPLCRCSINGRTGMVVREKNVPSEVQALQAPESASHSLDRGDDTSEGNNGGEGDRGNGYQPTAPPNDGNVSIQDAVGNSSTESGSPNVIIQNNILGIQSYTTAVADVVLFPLSWPSMLIELVSLHMQNVREQLLFHYVTFTHHLSGDEHGYDYGQVYTAHAQDSYHRNTSRGSAYDTRTASNVRSRVFSANSLHTYHRFSRYRYVRRVYDDDVDNAHYDLKFQEDVNQIQVVAPHIPRDMICRDLERTGNLQSTIDNIASGKIEVFS